MPPVTFNEDEFLGTQSDEALDTTRTPIPVGEYRADRIEDVKARAVEAREAGQNDRVVLDIIWHIDEPKVAKKMNFDPDNLTARQSIWLDLDDNGKIASGTNKNIQLGKLRDVLGQNTKGKPWSPQRLIGAGPALVEISHRPDKDDATIIYDQVAKVRKAS